MDVFQLLDECGAHASVTETRTTSQNWISDDTSIRHKQLDFFKIVPTSDQYGTRRLMIEQLETALVGLIVTKHENEVYLLLNCRCEPGLHNFCQLTSTIQSTPTNYLQKHGGAKTLFIDHFISDRDDSKVIHETSQFDWGDYYLAKIKKFKIVQIENLIEVSPPYIWVKYSEFLDLVENNYSLTTDLRSLTFSLEGALNSRTNDVDRSLLELLETKSTESKVVKKITFSEMGSGDTQIKDDLDRCITWVKFESESREVKTWEQPLLSLPRDLNLDLWIRREGSKESVAVQIASQAGLSGKNLLFPGLPKSLQNETSANLLKIVSTSAEGGRFFRHGVQIRIFEVTSETFNQNIHWLEKDQLIVLAQKSLLLSVELRIALSLLCNLDN